MIHMLVPNEAGDGLPGRQAVYKAAHEIFSSLEISTKSSAIE